ncbi:MAG: 2-oxoglutarate dehydrogenase E1 component [Lysobacterales bacterium]
MSAFLDQLYQSSPLSGLNADYVEAIYERYLVDPTSVDARWRSYFEQLRSGVGSEVPHGPIIERIGHLSRHQRQLVSSSGGSDADQARQAGVLKLINAYRIRGHLVSQLDPLNLTQPQSVPDLDLGFHGLSEADLETEFDAGPLVGPRRRKLRDIVDLLKATYTGTIGSEYMHLTDLTQRRWMQERLEGAGGRFGFSADKRKRILERLTAAEGMERYLHTQYVGQKRFSLEGGDSLIPLLDAIVHRAGGGGAKEIVIGMAHRGRLNVLVNLVGKPPQELFSAFEGKDQNDDPNYSGDVKYHLGFSSDLNTSGGRVHLALGFNPSHLEIIDPVVVGSVRARQTERGEAGRSQVIPILIHGDAAFAGQGVVMELLNMSQARGYAVGGTVHIVINNQVGFTTSHPQDARSTLYCTDVAKMVQAPILHVNGDDPEAVVYAAQMALDFRATFGKDVVLDLICYRRHGHNEADEPAATQPMMYQVIRSRPTTRELYARQLVEAGVIGADDAHQLSEAYRSRLAEGKVVAPDIIPHGEVTQFTFDWRPYLNGHWDDAVVTGMPIERLRDLAVRLNAESDHTKLHPRVAKIYADRRAMAAGDIPMDWGFAETLAYAALLDEGYSLRLSGQDCGRGTFFHRHAVVYDQNDGHSEMPLRRLVDDDRRSVIIDSLLSEEAVVGFEYGYASADPRTLVIWEAQFGDFCNGAQVVIDQFISSGESKWGRLCGLVMFLPHGYEGQGPEHSSARLERFLQLCALDNMQVCVPTTPAQMYHMIRRQMLRGFRKPLIVMTPKSMLRHKLSVSTMETLANGSFQLVIPDRLSKDDAKVERVVLCSGKVYYDLRQAFEERQPDNVAVMRVEQLYPFPRPQVKAEIARFANAREIVWCQEEPMNQGAWFQIRHHLQACIGEQHGLYYAGRGRSPAPAAGSFQMHQREQAALVEQALFEPQSDEHVPD